MAVGLPILVLATPGYSYFVEESGQFVCKTKEDFTNALRALTDLREMKKRSMAASDYARETCDLEKNLALELDHLANDCPGKR
jgi:glycosyltransferase involved in cell wall biosynthesis